MKMKLIVAALLVLCFSPLLKGQTNSYTVKQARAEKTINTQWTFNYFPETKMGTGYENANFDDSKWPVVSVPHTWMTYETTKELHPYVKNPSFKDSPYWWDGWGWYRKHLEISNNLKDKKIRIEFDAVQKYCKVWLNGKYLGDHKGGFTSFYFDITDAVNWGGDNVLVLAVNNSLNDKYQIPPMNAGNWTVYGGITRDVKLVVTDKVHIPYQGSYKHDGGTFVTTPIVNEKEGVVNVKTFVKNDNATVATTTLKSHIVDAKNNIIETLTETRKIDPGQMQTFEQRSKVIKNPNLWSPESPYLYQVYSEVYKDNVLVDSYKSPLGFRWFSWNYDRDRLFLNGKEVWVHGQNRHEEYVWLGGAFPQWIAERDMNDIKYNLNHNFMRTAHYPNAPYVYDYMDKNGIIINEELPNIKNQVFSDEVQENNAREMVRRDRNHPSIVFWSMGNETTDAADSKWVYDEDSTRIITSRHVYNESMGEYAPHSEKNMSIEGFLRCTIRGWYDKDDKNFEPDDGQHAGTEEHDHTMALIKDVQKHYGSVWLYADHGADREYVNSPLKHVNPKGWVDSWRTPKYKYYLWQANFATKPMVFIHPHFWRKQYLGQKKDFVIDSNCDEVELFVNGKSQGKLFPNPSNQFCVTFKNIEVKEGSIEAVATKNGEVVKNKVVLAGEPAKIVLTTTSKSIKAALDNIVEIKADIVDKNGVHCYGANPTLKWTLSGPGQWIGPDVYISDMDKLEGYEGTMYIDVPVTNLIRSTGKVGKIDITVTAGGLEAGKISVDVEKYSELNSIDGILEPILSLPGRNPVATNINQITTVKAPQEMKEYSGELHYSLSDSDNFKTKLQNFIVSENPNIPTQTPEFQYVLELFKQIMLAKNGELIADDYNFAVEQYNISRAITKHIYSLQFPQAYKEQLADYYAYQIVYKGYDKNFLSENKIVDKIPQKGKVFNVKDVAGKYKDVYYTKDTDLKSIVEYLYPETKSYTKDQWKSALGMVVNINPYVTKKSMRTKEDRKNRFEVYTIESEKYIFVPSPNSLLKNNFPNKKL